MDDVSSRLGDPSIEIARYISSNYMEMCRCSGLEDIEYQKVAASFQEIRTSLITPETNVVPECGSVPLRVPQSSGSFNLQIDAGPNLGRRQRLLDSLWSETIDARFKTIKPAHAKTSECFLSKSEYLEWLDMSFLEKHQGILWVKGKPGSGKSTLIKLLVANARKKMRDALVISFFFNARGNDLEKTTIGMYRSMIYQTMTAMPDVQVYLDRIKSASETGEDFAWTEGELREIFSTIIQCLGAQHLICFIDALDEGDEEQIREMLAFLEQLGQIALSSRISAHFCLSSRQYPHVSIDKSVQLILENEEAHGSDISKSLDGTLKVGHSKRVETIKNVIETKSSGIFLWVVLVVPILNKAYDDGRVHALQKRLNVIPKGLDELFQDILERAQIDIEDFILCLQWILYANRPLKREEIYFALIAGIEPETLPDVSKITVDDMDRYILSRS